MPSGQSMNSAGALDIPGHSTYQLSRGTAECQDCTSRCCPRFWFLLHVQKGRAEKRTDTLNYTNEKEGATL